MICSFVSPIKFLRRSHHGTRDFRNESLQGARCRDHDWYVFCLRPRHGTDDITVTNAAGGLNPDYSVGDIVCLNDHLNMAGLVGFHPLRGANADDFGVRFPPLSDAYDLGLRQKVHQTWQKVRPADSKRRLHEGVYAFVAGPTYETRAECRMLHQLGADVVGMSTVPEIIVARHSGIKILAFSLVTNNAVLQPVPRGDDPSLSSMSPQELVDHLSKGKANHEEVIEAGREAAKDMQVRMMVVLCVKRCRLTEHRRWCIALCRICRDDDSSLLRVERALGLQILVVGLLSACLGCLDVAVLSLETAKVLLARQDFLDEGLLAIFVVESAREVLGRTFNDGADVGVLRRSHLAVLLLVMSVRIKNVTHLQQLEISLQLWGEIGTGHVVPLFTSSGFLRLEKQSMLAKIFSDVDV
jgi:inosine/guanosine/xanthosine phosphorylase family protein